MAAPLSFRDSLAGRPSGHNFDIPELWKRNYQDTAMGRKGVGETCLVNHVTLRMPTLVSVIPVDLDKLLQYSTVAACALCCEAGRVVEMAVYIAVVLVVGILGAKQGSAEGTCKMLDVVFLICSHQQS
jgi:hypothetical protein